MVQILTYACEARILNSMCKGHAQDSLPHSLGNGLWNQCRSDTCRHHLLSVSQVSPTSEVDNHTKCKLPWPIIIYRSLVPSQTMISWCVLVTYCITSNWKRRRKVAHDGRSIVHVVCNTYCMHSQNGPPGIFLTEPALNQRICHGHSVTWILLFYLHDQHFLLGSLVRPMYWLS